jgi:FkbM family methyltransferase
MIGPWGPLRVILTLLRDARGSRSKAWVLAYFVSRARVFGRQPLVVLAPRPRLIKWHSSESPLSVSVESGGLSSWYEISHRLSYAPLGTLRPQPGWTIVDVGANIGAYTVWAAGHLGSTGRIVAIEPNPVSFDRLRKSVQHLPIPVSAFQVGCSDTPGSAALYFEEGYTVSASLQHFAQASRAVEVQLRRLDDVLQEAGTGRVDLIKIDVEGAEELVLRGAPNALAKASAVILETNEAIEPGVRALLADAGFRLAHEASSHWDIPGLRLLAFTRLAGAPN